MTSKIIVSTDAPPVVQVRNGDSRSKVHLLWMYNSADVSVVLNENAMCGISKPKNGWIIELKCVGRSGICKSCQNIYTKESML